MKKKKLIKKLQRKIERVEAFSTAESRVAITRLVFDQVHLVSS